MMPTIPAVVVSGFRAYSMSLPVVPTEQPLQSLEVAAAAAVVVIAARRDFAVSVTRLAVPQRELVLLPALNYEHIPRPTCSPLLLLELVVEEEVVATAVVAVAATAIDY
jgi:hypothetical protein